MSERRKLLRHTRVIGSQFWDSNSNELISDLWFDTAVNSGTQTGICYGIAFHCSVMVVWVEISSHVSTEPSWHRLASRQLTNTHLAHYDQPTSVPSIHEYTLTLMFLQIISTYPGHWVISLCSWTTVPTEVKFSFCWIATSHVVSISNPVWVITDSWFEALGQRARTKGSTARWLHQKLSQGNSRTRSWTELLRHERE